MLDHKLITTACHLYRQSFVPLLPYSLVYAVLLLLMDLPIMEHYYIYIAVLTLPVLTSWIVIFDKVYKKKSIDITETILQIVDRFPALMGALISIVLLPAIILLVGMVLSLLLEKSHFIDLGIRLVQIITLFAAFAAFIPKSFAPLLVFTESLDPNTALDKSNDLIKGHFIKIYLYELYAIVFFALLFLLPYWLHWCVPAAKTLPYLTLPVISALLTSLLGSWSVALWYCLLSDRIASASKA